MLEAEGVSFNQRGRCELQKYLWVPAETEGKRKARAEKGSLFKH
jgi:hypothetical protein